MLYNLQLLRVVAALSVVYFHTTSDAGLGLDWNVGSRGVDIFFVISGFIIAYVGTSNPNEFFRRRLIRVVPFYWAATLAVFALVLVAPSLFRSTNADFLHLFMSLLFIPHESVTGEMHPTLILGWSLNFEMFFYASFAIALTISRKWSPLICASWLILFVLAVHLSGTQSQILDFYARPVVLEFCYGIAVFYLVDWTCARRDSLMTSRLLLWALAGTLVVSLAALYVLELRYAENVPRYIAAGIPAVLVVASALLLERIFNLTSKNRFLFLLAEASYIIYLIHTYIVFGVLRLLVSHADRLPAAAIVVLVLGLLALVSGIAVAIHLVFEKPVMAFLRSRLPSSRKTGAATIPGGSVVSGQNSSAPVASSP
jgi:peptidoglycan/LPS O-acetylase OafA/YrhL